MKSLTFNISEEAFNLLKEIEKRPAEYRDREFRNLDEFKNSDLAKIKSDEHFLNRNNGGTYYLIEELESSGLVESDGESWHLTYVITWFGREILKNNK